MTVVERARPESLDDVWKLLAAFAQAVGEPGPDDAGRSRIAEAAARGAIEFHVARDGETPVGLGSMTVGFSTYRASPIALLDDVYVAPDHRGQGVARLLCDSLRAAARERGCASVLGGCSAADVAIWAHFGFRPIGTLMACDLGVPPRGA